MQSSCLNFFFFFLFLFAEFSIIVAGIQENSRTKLKAWQPHDHFKVSYHSLFESQQQVFKNVAVNQTVFVLLTNAGYIDFANNSLIHFRLAMPGLTLMIVCYDDAALAWCQKENDAECVIAKTFGLYCTSSKDQETGYIEYYRQSFRLLQICRLAILYYILKSNLNAFWMDPDSVLLRNPLPLIAKSAPALWFGACHPPEQPLMGQMKITGVHRNIGMMWIGISPRSRLATKQSLFKMYYSSQGRRAHDQYLFNDMFAKYRVATYCTPYEFDGLSCNLNYWKTNWEAPVRSENFWNLHAACAPRGTNEKKLNKKKWLVSKGAWKSS